MKMNKTASDKTIDQKLLNRQRFREWRRSQSIWPPVNLVLSKNRQTYWDAGCGHGEFLVGMAKRDENSIFFGTEIKRRRSEETRFRIARAKLVNAYIFRYDSSALAEDMPDECLDGIYVNHPDPWPKDRHHKNRLIGPDTVKEFSRILKKNGFLLYASDHKDAALAAREVLEGEHTLENTSGKGEFVHDVEGRILTRYESKARDNGQPIYFLNYQKKS